LKGATPPPRTLGRFRLLRELGRGAQAQVWLAHDPRLEREVALKMLDRHADATALAVWMHEARVVGRLAHPNVVPVFEADEHEGQPYLVFELVDGPTLAQARRGQGPMPARQAVQLMLGVLDALAAAHEQGIVHRDLKPSNILLGSDGRPRVMDFGIAARVAQPDLFGAGVVLGTPGYISPEAARGEPPVPAMDVFAAGVVLAELLCGQPLLRETDPWRALHRVQAEDLLLPGGGDVDAPLRGIVQRALSRETARRHDSARSLHAALSAWLQPPEDAAAPSSHATLEFLLRRMRHKSDFPALSAQVVSIQRVANSERERLGRLADEILKDVALTHKLLRMVNTARFAAVADGGIATVSRAVALVGFAGIRNMALSVVLLEHMPDKAHAALLKEEFLRALAAATVAESLCGNSRGHEDAFLGAMFQNLGRLLTEFYLPDEAVLIRQQITAAGAADATAVRAAAARRVLGLSQEELGSGVARAWGLPASLQQALQPPQGAPPARPVPPGVERLRWLGVAANELADAMLSCDGPAQADAVRRVADRHAAALDLPARDIASAALGERVRLASLAQAMGLQMTPGTAARRLLQAALPAGDDATLVLADASASATATATATSHGTLDAALRTARQALASRTLAQPDVLLGLLDAMRQALDFRCVVLCLRQPGGALAGRHAVGVQAAAIRPAFRFHPDPHAVGDLFAWLCAQGMDLLVSDASAVAGRLPAWFRQQVAAPTFLLLPLQRAGVPVGLIYADKAQAGSLVLAEADLALMRALRDQLAQGCGS